MSNNMLSNMDILRRASTKIGSDPLIALAHGQVPVKAIRSLTLNLEKGNKQGAMAAANYISKQLKGKTRGTIICGVKNLRDHRRPVVIERRRIETPLSVAAGADAVAAIQAAAGFIDTADNRRFLNSSQQVVSGSEQLLLRPQVHGRLLVGIGVAWEFIVQPAPSGIAGMADEWTSRYLTGLFYQYGAKVFPTAGAEPQMDTTPTEYFRAGAGLQDNLRVPFNSDNARIELVVPGTSTEAADGSKPLPQLTFGEDVQITGHLTVTGLYVSSGK